MGRTLRWAGWISGISADVGTKQAGVGETWGEPTPGAGWCQWVQQKNCTASCTGCFRRSLGSSVRIASDDLRLMIESYQFITLVLVAGGGLFGEGVLGLGCDC